jgi:hypothetical protein
VTSTTAEPNAMPMRSALRTIQNSSFLTAPPR